MKACTKCGAVKSLEEYGKDPRGPQGRRSECSACSSIYRKKHRLANLTRIRAYIKNWQQNNREKTVIAARNWVKNNPERARENERRRRRDNPNVRLTKNLRTRVRLAVSGFCKSASTLKLLGCSVEEFKAHLEKQFVPGMTWENYGPTWHVDHIKPCAKFDLSDPAQQRACFHYSNTQPLFAGDNIRKRDK